MTELAVLFALEAKVGIDGSAVVTSIDWKLADARTRLTTAEAEIVTNAAAIATEAAARAAADSTINSTLATKADLVAGVGPSSQLPSYVDDVLEFTNFAAFPGTGETGKIWCMPITSGCKPVFSETKSKILFYKNQFPFLPSLAEVRDILRWLNAVKRTTAG